jgi:hypothetical protein
MVHLNQNAGSQVLCDLSGIVQPLAAERLKIFQVVIADIVQIVLGEAV